VDITYFNWYEIYQAARKDPAAIIILTYGLTKDYNEAICWRHGKSLLNLLNIHHIPSFMFQSGLLEASQGSIYSTFETKQTQSYIKNTKFLRYNVAAKFKVDYIKALSMRRMSDKSDRIQREYIEGKIDNPFLTYDEDFIYFRYESLDTEKTS
jgi:hypothetical protein